MTKIREGTIPILNIPFTVYQDGNFPSPIFFLKTISTYYLTIYLSLLHPSLHCFLESSNFLMAL